MKPQAIVYTSNTGFTLRYAQMLSKITGLPIYDLKDKTLKKKTPVVFMGWLMAGKLVGYKKANRRFSLVAVCSVSLGTPKEQVQLKNKITVPVFALRGGMDHNKLTGIYKKMIDALISMLEKKQRTQEESAILNMIKAGGDFVTESNLAGVIRFVRQSVKKS